MNMMKYIITINGPVIFPTSINHADVAIGLGRIRSAGFVSIEWDDELNQFEARTSGRSHTLDIDSYPLDYLEIRNMLNLHYKHHKS
jgi:hypothetical protein